MLVNQKKNKGKETTSNLTDKNTNLSQIQEGDTNVDEDTRIRNRHQNQHNSVIGNEVELKLINAKIEQLALEEKVIKINDKEEQEGKKDTIQVKVPIEEALVKLPKGRGREMEEFLVKH